ncbi:hypothetical protein [Haloactinomyces albus]|uniref:J domain-containing protein n=1 Tax=Haloactinomyces albus TaxID=1352928 RepID=A0AAE3ZFU5_9ACTN|nr:hypothetical protein [Haloactinomyces albus]MDR7303195.1 hypothetical protein [Haloactinomyces albus]
MTMTTGKPAHDSGEQEHAAATAQAALRAFVRRHHPDVGGDPDVFAAGLAELRAARDRERPGAEHPAGTSDRGDAPIVVVARPRGLRGLVQRLRTRCARKRRAPRVR